jgi:hypothetical protein
MDGKNSRRAKYQLYGYGTTDDDNDHVQTILGAHHKPLPQFNEYWTLIPRGTMAKT